jgi:type VI protein secretion system component Hcp
MAGDLPDVYLQFPQEQDFKGECNDVDHPGEEGWITIKSFTFGFGFPGKDDSSESEDDKKKKEKDDKTKGTKDAKGEKDGKKKGKKTEGMKSGPMTFDPISFSKSSDRMSTSLMKACRLGDPIDKVVLHVCRPGGTDGDVKLPFLIMTFEDVHVKSCKLNLVTDGLPTEDVEFSYEKVKMTSYWTDNATGGDRLKYGPLSVEWEMAKGNIDENATPDPVSN